MATTSPRLRVKLFAASLITALVSVVLMVVGSSLAGATSVPLSCSSTRVSTKADGSVDVTASINPTSPKAGEMATLSITLKGAPIDENYDFKSITGSVRINGATVVSATGTGATVEGSGSQVGFSITTPIPMKQGIPLITATAQVQVSLTSTEVTIDSSGISAGFLVGPTILGDLPFTCSTSGRASILNASVVPFSGNQVVVIEGGSFVGAGWAVGQQVVCTAAGIACGTANPIGGVFQMPIAPPTTSGAYDYVFTQGTRTFTIRYSIGGPSALQVSPNPVQPGQTATISGRVSVLDRGSQYVDCSFGQQSCGSMKAERSGAFSFTYVVPAGYPNGLVIVSIRGSEDYQTASVMVGSPASKCSAADQQAGQAIVDKIKVANDRAADAVSNTQTGTKALNAKIAAHPGATATQKDQATQWNNKAIAAAGTIAANLATATQLSAILFGPSATPAQCTKALDDLKALDAPTASAGDAIVTSVSELNKIVNLLGTGGTGCSADVIQQGQSAADWTNFVAASATGDHSNGSVVAASAIASNANATAAQKAQAVTLLNDSAAQNSTAQAKAAAVAALMAKLKASTTPQAECASTLAALSGGLDAASAAANKVKDDRAKLEALLASIGTGRGCSADQVSWANWFAGAPDYHRNLYATNMDQAALLNFDIQRDSRPSATQKAQAESIYQAAKNAAVDWQSLKTSVDALVQVLRDPATPSASCIAKMNELNGHVQRADAASSAAVSAVEQLKALKTVIGMLRSPGGVDTQSALEASSGPSGVSGESASQRSTGASGIDAATGSTGGSGVSGATGSTGDSGVTGTTGLTGDSGVTGLTGATGDSGASGATGATGATGGGGADTASACGIDQRTAIDSARSQIARFNDASILIYSGQRVGERSTLELADAIDANSKSSAAQRDSAKAARVEGAQRTSDLAHMSKEADGLNASIGTSADATCGSVVTTVTEMAARAAGFGALIEKDNSTLKTILVMLDNGAVADANGGVPTFDASQPVPTSTDTNLGDGSPLPPAVPSDPASAQPADRQCVDAVAAVGADLEQARRRVAALKSRHEALLDVAAGLSSDPGSAAAAQALADQSSQLVTEADKALREVEQHVEAVAGGTDCLSHATDSGKARLLIDDLARRVEGLGAQLDGLRASSATTTTLVPADPTTTLLAGSPSPAEASAQPATPAP